MLTHRTFHQIGQGGSCSFDDLQKYELQVGENSPIIRWLSTGTLDLTVFDDADEQNHFGTAKVRSVA